MRKHVKNDTFFATTIYVHAMRKQIEEEVKSRYLKRIDYLVGANDELMNQLEQYEKVSMQERV